MTTMTDAKDFSTSTTTAISTPSNSSPDLPRRIAFQTPSFLHSAVADDDEPPENIILEHFTPRPRSMSHHLSSTKIPSRSWLLLQARFLRWGMRLGMRFHEYAPPKPPKASFVRQIQTDTIPIGLYFYVPSDYHSVCRNKPDYRYPVVVNFHGGGFCLGDPTDDRYYARVILAHTPAIFVSVDYRKAPEHPFPVPVDDSVEALLYLTAHASELHLDPSKVALTGFSAGANLSFSVPFRLTYHTDKHNPRQFVSSDSPAVTPAVSRTQTQQSYFAPSSTTQLDTINSASEPEDDGYLHPSTAQASSHSLLNSSTTDVSNRFLSPHGAQPSSSSSAAQPPSTRRRPPLPLRLTSSNRISDALTQIQSQSNTPMSANFPSQTPMSVTFPPDLDTNNNNQTTRPPLVSKLTSHPVRSALNLKILTVVAWYPLLDWTSSRASKKRSSLYPKKTLSKTLTDLFDYSYLPPPDPRNDHCSPYASPALAPDDMIVNGLPQRIQMWLCEYDMLLAEGKIFAERLERLGKDINWEMIPGVPHGWDKSPNPFRDQNKIDSLYLEAARRLREVFEEADEDESNVVGERIGLGGRR